MTFEERNELMEDLIDTIIKVVRGESSKQILKNLIKELVDLHGEEFTSKLVNEAEEMIG